MKKKTIEDATSIIPEAVSDGVIGEIEQFLGDSFDAKARAHLDGYLSNNLRTVYANNKRFAKKLAGRGNSGRDYAYSFMRHWAAAELKKVAPAIFRKLPASFANGMPLS
jgi:hypothetical protein